MISMLTWYLDFPLRHRIPSKGGLAGPAFMPVKIVLLPLPADCIYPYEVRRSARRKWTGFQPSQRIAVSRAF
jgi:hypothetical protein